jgi:hypothetical protein
MNQTTQQRRKRDAYRQLLRTERLAQAGLKKVAVIVPLNQVEHIKEYAKRLESAWLAAKEKTDA